MTTNTIESSVGPQSGEEQDLKEQGLEAEAELQKSPEQEQPGEDIQSAQLENEYGNISDTERQIDSMLKNAQGTKEQLDQLRQQMGLEKVPSQENAGLKNLVGKLEQQKKNAEDLEKVMLDVPEQESIAKQEQQSAYKQPDFEEEMEKIAAEIQEAQEQLKEARRKYVEDWIKDAQEHFHKEMEDKGADLKNLKQAEKIADIKVAYAIKTATKDFIEKNQPLGMGETQLEWEIRSFGAPNGEKINYVTGLKATHVEIEAPDGGLLDEQDQQQNPQTEASEPKENEPDQQKNDKADQAIDQRGIKQDLLSEQEQEQLQAQEKAGNLEQDKQQV